MVRVWRNGNAAARVDARGGKQTRVKYARTRPDRPARPCRQREERESGRGKVVGPLWWPDTGTRRAQGAHRLTVEIVSYRWRSRETESEGERRERERERKRDRKRQEAEEEEGRRQRRILAGTVEHGFVAETGSSSSSSLSLSPSISIHLHSMGFAGERRSKIDRRVRGS